MNIEKFFLKIDTLCLINYIVGCVWGGCAHEVPSTALSILFAVLMQM